MLTSHNSQQDKCSLLSNILDIWALCLRIKIIHMHENMFNIVHHGAISIIFNAYLH